MIVIPSHDKIDYLTNLLDSILVCDLNGHDILVVDTNSQSQQYIAEWPKLKEKYPSVIFDRRDVFCYEAGAAIYAIKNYPREKYIFIQDSLEILNKRFFVDVDEKLKYFDVVGMLNFKFQLHVSAFSGYVAGGYIRFNEDTMQQYDSLQQKKEAEDGLGEFKTFPDNGIFGSMFAANKSILDKINPEWFNSEPRDKQGSCMWERRWALIFHVLGAKVSFMYHITTVDEWNYFHSNFFHGNNWPYNKHFKKVLGGRQ